MKSFIPSSRCGSLRAPLAALAAVAFVGFSVIPDASAKMPNIRKEARIAVSFDLAPPVETSSADGTAEIEILEGKKSASTTLTVDVTGLAAGEYPVHVVTIDDATAAETPVLVGEFTVVAPAPATGTTGEPSTTETEIELEIAFPAGVDPLEVDKLTVSSTTVDPTTSEETTTVVLEGLAVAATTDLNFFANVPVTAPPASALTTPPASDDEPVTEDGKGNGKGKGSKPSKVKKVHGHALAKAVIVDGVTQKQSFLFVAHGAPANIALEVHVNGAKVSDVTSSKNGKVMFKGVPETVDFGTLDLVTIVDPATGLPVMQADFQ